MADGCVLGRGVLYHKAIAHDQLVDLMRQSVALLNTSLAEGMCGSILEVTCDVLPKIILRLYAFALRCDLLLTGNRLYSLRCTWCGDCEDTCCRRSLSRRLSLRVLLRETSS